MKRKAGSILESIVTVAIILVLLQTLAEDIFTVFGAPWNLRRLFIFTAVAFDLLFTVEFLVRSWNAILNRTFVRYFFRENGWVDFIASVPLLIFTSGPTFLALMQGSAFAGTGAMIGLLKVVKAVRMARVLRLLRLLKIFRRIRFADSVMVQRHTVRIVTTVAATLIFTITAVGMVFALIDDVGAEEVWIADQRAAVETLTAGPSPSAAAMAEWGESRPSVILIQSGNRTLFSAHDETYLTRHFGPGDYSVTEIGGFSIWLDLRPAAVTLARTNIMVFIATLVVVIMIMVTYSPHFAITVSDPVNVMLRGLKEKSYNLEVSVPSGLEDDDVFRLAEAYNDEYLPLKERSNIKDQGSALDISLDDISDLLGS